MNGARLCGGADDLHDYHNRHPGLRPGIQKSGAVLTNGLRLGGRNDGPRDLSEILCRYPGFDPRIV